MTTPRSPGSSGILQIVGRLLAGVMGGAAALVFALMSGLIVSSLLGPASQDPHGYSVIFGTLLALPSGLLAAVLVPFAFPPARRPRAQRIALLLTIAAFAALLAVGFLA